MRFGYGDITCVYTYNPFVVFTEGFGQASHKDNKAGNSNNSYLISKSVARANACPLVPQNTYDICCSFLELSIILTALLFLVMDLSFLYCF